LNYFFLNVIVHFSMVRATLARFWKFNWRNSWHHANWWRLDIPNYYFFVLFMASDWSVLRNMTTCKKRFRLEARAVLLKVWVILKIVRTNRTRLRRLLPLKMAI